MKKILVGDKYDIDEDLLFEKTELSEYYERSYEFFKEMKDKSVDD